MPAAFRSDEVSVEAQVLFASRQQVSLEVCVGINYTAANVSKVIKGEGAMSSHNENPVSLFYSYSHKDEALRGTLETHLSLLRRQGVISTWHDRLIGAGEDWGKEIDEHLDFADIILLLVSADFLASDYCYGKELKRAMERHEADEACVIPVILRPVDWHSAPFAMLQACPRDGRPVSKWRSRDDAFTDVSKAIRKAAKRLKDFPNGNDTEGDFLADDDEGGAVATAITTESITVQVTIDRDFRAYSEEDQRELLEAIRIILNKGGRLKAGPPRPGSVKYDIEGLTSDDLERLLLAFERGDLSRYGVSDMVVIERSPSSQLSTKVRELFAQVRTVSISERDNFLDKNCDDAVIRAQVERLLANDGGKDEGWSFEVPAFESPNWIGRQVGDYTIEAKIAQGGMGEVYRARRTVGFEQRVAVKLLRHQLSEDWVRRFPEEVRIQARLASNESVAAVYDAGVTDDGVPYIVMDYVEGTPITEYCEREDLNVRERVKLLQQVCSALSFAHHNLVLHRDIKPSNVLVTDHGTIRLLDFGIASDVSEQSTTLTESKWITPQYASPEQLRGERLSTATDAYSLGVLAYELLTGSPPYDVSGLSRATLDRIIDQIDPPFPSEKAAAKLTNDTYSSDSRKASRLRRELVGDLDAIVMKLLEKFPEDRYHSVAELASDLQRYLVAEPVLAMRPTFVYRMRKFLQRNLLVSSLSLMVILMVLVTAILGVILFQ